MLSGTVGTERGYDLTEPKFQTAFAFLRRDDLGSLPEGWIALEHGVRASVQLYTTMPEETLDFETHERFFDIQYLVDGEEYIGVTRREGRVEKKPYAEQDDITFYETPERAGRALLRAGDYVVLAPEDAHKPRCLAGSAMPVRKIVVKVPV